MAVGRERFIVLDSAGGDGTTRNTSGATAAYASLAAAEAAEQSNLTGEGSDGDPALWFRCSGRTTGSNAENGLVIFNGYITTAADYILIQADDGTGGTGAYNGKGLNTGDTFSADFYYIAAGTSGGLNLADNHIRVEDLQFDMASTGNNNYCVQTGALQIPNDIRVCRSFFTYSGSGSGGRAIVSNNVNADLDIENNVIDFNDGVGVCRGIWIFSGTSSTLYNNTVYGPATSGTGIQFNAGTNRAYNNASGNWSDDFALSGGTNTLNFNASDDGDGSNPVTLSATRTDDWTDPANGDFTIPDSGSVLADAGDTDGGSAPSTDKQGTSFGTQDIGAFAFTGVAPSGGLVGPLAGPGGLAGHGGLAGRRGGLAG